MATTLTQAQKRFLRGLGQAREPTLHIGRDGLTPAVIAALDPLLTRHELVKGKVQQTSAEEPAGVAATLAETSSAALVGVVGRTFLLFRPNPERKDPIQLP